MNSHAHQALVLSEVVSDPSLEPATPAKVAGLFVSSKCPGRQRQYAPLVLGRRRRGLLPQPRRCLLRAQAAVVRRVICLMAPILAPAAAGFNHDLRDARGHGRRSFLTSELGPLYSANSLVV